ncbi:MAG: PIG-L deacetylase family protein [Dehalococcoidia bacterium]|nr:PIG-L deacetylase family protein [Dehalococcoidia bacterium]
MARLNGLLAWRPWRRSAAPAEELGKHGPLTAMVIVAHPDDAEFLCGGTVAKWCAQGWTVYYVLATSGDKGTHDESLSQQELAAVREQEQRDACRALGVRDVSFLGLPDGFLQPDAELRGQIVRLLRRYRPDVVLTWDGFRSGFNHSDHRAVGIATRDAVYPAVRDHLYYAEHRDEGLDPHQVNELLLAGSDDPDYHVDIGPYVETKLEAVLCHRSQLGNRSEEEIRRMWRDRMRPSRNGRLTESFKWIRIRRSMRQEQPPGQPAAAAAQPPSVRQE